MTQAAAYPISGRAGFSGVNFVPYLLARGHAVTDPLARNYQWYLDGREHIAGQSGFRHQVPWT
jgi:hypothetical protein